MLGYMRIRCQGAAVGILKYYIANLYSTDVSQSYLTAERVSRFRLSVDNTDVLIRSERTCRKVFSSDRVFMARKYF